MSNIQHFASFPFLVFLFCTVVIYYIFPRRHRWTVLLTASLAFYGFADPSFLIYICVTIISAHFAAVKMKSIYAKRDADISAAKKEQRKGIKAAAKKSARFWMVACLVFNFGILAVIKYTNFMLSNVNFFLPQESQLGFVTLAVPLGISYYTFKSMSYIIDAYREKAEPQKNIFKYALFVSFFPQIIQGPISRYGELSKTLYAGAAFDWKNIRYGALRILWGFFKKLVIANRLMPAVNALRDRPDEYTGIYVLINMLLYAITLYCDFTGGIDITVGAAETMGIRMEENFDRPFYSKSIAEYWRRWHITMGTWFKDYLFYPMSVSKPMLRLSKKLRGTLGEGIGKRIPVYIVTVLLWFMTGLWHGATWNFIVWGLVNGAVILVSQELQPLYAKFRGRFKFSNTAAYAAFQIFRTFWLMSAIRMFDRYDGVGNTLRMLASSVTEFSLSDFFARGGLGGMELDLSGYISAGLGVCVVLLVSFMGRGGVSARERLFNAPWALRYAAVGALFFMVLIFGAYGLGYDAQQFIYNQF